VGRRLRVHAGAYRQALIAALVLAVSPVAAAPSSPDAKKAFDKGVAAYQHGDYAGAAAAFGKSYSLEVDAETAFAWAQAERKLDHCDKAVELYGKLLAMDLPAENKAVIRGQIAECKQIMDAQRPKKTEPKSEPKPEPKAEPTPEPKPEPTAEPTPEPVKLTPEPATSAEGRPWYRDPVGDTFVIAGVVGLGVGGALLVSAHSASQGIPGAPTYDAAKALADQSDSRGTLGTISVIAGAGLVAAGIVWYSTHHEKHATVVSGWLDRGSGGLAVAGGF
jgi:tetratricopeptide (TPR) repeat protein